MTASVQAGRSVFSMAEVDERWVRAEINRLGLKWRQEYMADDMVMASYYDWMMDALADLLVRSGVVDSDGAGELVETAKGIEE